MTYILYLTTPTIKLRSHKNYDCLLSMVGNYPIFLDLDLIFHCISGFMFSDDYNTSKRNYGSEGVQ